MPKLLVTGASGQLGQLVLNSLVEDQNVAPADIVAGTRKPESLADWSQRGIDVRKVDFDDPDLAGALQGVDRVLIISTDAVDAPGRRLEQHKKAVAAARSAGVTYIAYTSLPNAETSAVSFAPDHLGTEQAIRESGIDHTILRNAWYMENLFASLAPALASGQWFTSAGEGKTSYVSRADCARAAAAALAKATPGETILTVTGPQAYTNQQVAELVATASGKDLSVVQVNDEQLKQGMIGAGLPEPVAETFVSFDVNTREGHIDLVTDTVKSLTGRDPETLEAFVSANKAAF